MKKNIHFLTGFLCITLLMYLLINRVYAQKSPSIVNQAKNKVLSGRLLEKINLIEKLSSTQLKSSILSESKVFFYFSEFPSSDQITFLDKFGVKLMRETWTPPLENHPFGFIAASVPDKNLQEVIAISAIKKIDIAERSSHAMNNTASQMVGASVVWPSDSTRGTVTIPNSLEMPYATALQIKSFISGEPTKWGGVQLLK
jgi:hypothetical protein